MPFHYDSQCPEGHWQNWERQGEKHSSEVKVTIDESIIVNKDKAKRKCRVCKKTKSASQFMTSEANGHICKSCFDATKKKWS